MEDGWAEGLFDEARGLLWNPPGAFDDEGVGPRSVHVVPQSSWFALAAASRGDGARVAAIVDALLALQYDEPGTPWHGTFAKHAEKPAPTAGAVEWEDYDPNWRQFVGISFALLRRHHRALLSPASLVRIEDAIRSAVAGEQASGRLHWHYTNVALQHAWLLVEAGERSAGLGLAERIVDRWRRRHTFPEFNAPTYDGVDLFALALWRGHSDDPQLQAWGAELEDGLWRTIAGRYHAGLRNIAGPYTRAYGLDLRRYVGKVGLQIGIAAGADVAPLPPALDGAAHCHDVLSLPSLRLAGSAAPPDALRHLRAFRGERSVHDVITERPTRREATAWLGDDVMIGAEDGDSDWTGWFQFVAGTIHWRRPDGDVGVLRYVPDGPPRGRAEPGVLRLAGPGHLELAPEGHHTTRRAGAVLPLGRTSLPGVDVTITKDGTGLAVEVSPRPS